MRLIDADALKIDYGFTWSDITPTHDELYELIDRQPTIDAEPVIHGEWIPKNKDGAWRVDTCSVCKKDTHYVRYAPPDERCPHCGARMNKT